MHERGVILPLTEGQRKDLQDKTAFIKEQSNNTALIWARRLMGADLPNDGFQIPPLVVGEVRDDELGRAKSAVILRFGENSPTFTTNLYIRSRFESRPRLERIDFVAIPEKGGSLFAMEEFGVDLNGKAIVGRLDTRMPFQFDDSFFSLLDEKTRLQMGLAHAEGMGVLLRQLSRLLPPK